jgi:hypothetical protein
MQTSRSLLARNDSSANDTPHTVSPYRRPHRRPEVQTLHDLDFRVLSPPFRPFASGGFRLPLPRAAALARVRRRAHINDCTQPSSRLLKRGKPHAPLSSLRTGEQAWQQPTQRVTTRHPPPRLSMPAHVKQKTQGIGPSWRMELSSSPKLMLVTLCLWTPRWRPTPDTKTSTLPPPLFQR